MNIAPKTPKSPPVNDVVNRNNIANIINPTPSKKKQENVSDYGGGDKNRPPPPPPIKPLVLSQ
jgi:hypothetical protein